MKTSHKLTSLAGLLLAIFAVGSAFGATTIVSDNYNVTTATTGFTGNNGVNYNVATRLAGSTLSNLRYLYTQTGTPKVTTAFGISSSKLAVASAANSGRFTLSSDGTTPFNFASALGSSTATPASPAVYEIVISMANNAAGTQRCSFGLGTVENDATYWDFGIQLWRAASGDNFYSIQKRIDTGSSGLGADLNDVILTTAATTYGTETNLLIRVTDAGAETTTFNSRVQVSANGGSTWLYDTYTDPDLPNGWRLDGAGRYIMWDIAGSAVATYDNFSVTVLPPKAWSGAGTDDNWSTGNNWGGVTPATGEMLIFAGTTRQTSTNDLSLLAVPCLTFNNGGFVLGGNEMFVRDTLKNLAGVNRFESPLGWSTTFQKTWALASGSELQLNSTTTIEVNGDNTLLGGGTLRVGGTMNIGQTTTANPAINLNEGKFVVDGGTFNSRGGFRIGTLATGAGAQTIVSNGATFALTVSGGNLRVGDSANPNPSRLIVDNSTLTMAGGSLAIPYAPGATGEVAQVGGLISGPTVNFSQSSTGARLGTYAITNGTLEAIQIKKTATAGIARMYLNGATVRTAANANNAFFTGLTLAELQAGGLTLDATTDVTVGQVFSGSGSLTKSGAATVTLSGVNTYSGATTVSQGRLLVTGSLAAGSAVSVLPGGLLGGTGTINGSISVSGALSTGSSAGKLTTGAITLNSGGTNIWEISSATGTAGTSWDLVDAGANNVDVQSASGSPFTFKLVSLGLVNFNKDTAYSWPAISGTVLNFDADKFAIDDSGFTNDLAGGTFSVEPGSLNVGFANNHAPVANAASFSFAKGVPFKPFTVSIASLTSDADGDTRALVSVTSTNATVSTTATDITISSENGVAESIQYVIQDVRNYRAGDTVRMATSYIHIVRTNSVGAVVVSNLGGTNMTLSFYGIPDYQYVIQRSPDMSTWTDVMTNAAASNGLFEYSETPPWNPAFYRVRSE